MQKKKINKTKDTRNLSVCVYTVLNYVLVFPICTNRNACIIKCDNS